MAGAQHKSNPIVNYRMLGIAEGLTVREVLCAVQDNRGFIWFGTDVGLTKYDGETFTLFNAGNSKMRGDRLGLVKDETGLIWMFYAAPFSAFSQGTVDILDPESNAIITFSERFKNAPFPETAISCLLSSVSGGVYICLVNGDCYLYAKGAFTKQGSIKNNDAGLTNWNVIYPGQLWITHSSFSDEREKALNEGRCNHEGPGSLVLQVDKSGRTTVLKFKGDAHWLVVDSQCTLKLTSINLNGVDEAKLFSGDVQLIRSPLCREVIFYSGSSGLYLFGDNSLVPLITGEEFAKLKGMLVFNFLKDQLGNYWLCTSMGIIQVGLRSNRFTHYLGKGDNTGDYFHQKQARGIIADEGGDVWTLQSNLFMFDSNGVQKSNIRLPGSGFSLEKIEDQLFLASHTLYKTSTETFKWDTLARTPAITEFWAMEYLGNQQFLLGGWYGWAVYNDADHSLKVIEYTGAAKGKPVNAGWVMDFIKTSDIKIWAASDNGLYLLDENYNVAERFAPDAVDSLHRKPFSQLLHGYEDAKGIFWLAGRTGLIRWDRSTGAVKRFTTEEGLSSNIIYRIEQDEKGYLWLSSNYGLMCFDTATFTVKIYTTKDGLSDNEFNRLSSYKAADGRMYFGGVNGVNGFNPHRFWNDSGVTAPLQVVSFQQYSEKLEDRTAALLQQQKIVMNPGDKFFVLKFCLLDYEKGKHQYAYKLEGVDANWNYINETSLRISGLPPGQFILHIKAQNMDGHWNVSELKIPVTVIAPIWQRTWFRITAILLLLIAVYSFIRYRTYRLSKDKEALEQTVKLRTEQMRGLLDDKDILLKEIHHRVKNNLQVIGNLLEMQGEEHADGKTQSAFNEAKARVRSVALIHQNLYRQDDLSGIELHGFVDELTTGIDEVFKEAGKTVTVQNDIPKMHLDIDTAVPLGLMLNELLTNAYKYAFKARSAGHVHISLQHLGDGDYRLTFTDDGPGLQGERLFENAATLGLRMIKRLAVQIMGEVDYTYDNGSRFTITFKDLKARKSVD